MSAISKGLEGVVATDTQLGDVRGQEGRLVYCGYDITELAGKASFEEVIYLLWHNKLPNRSELDELKKQVSLVRDPGLSLSTPASKLPLGVSASYWLDLRGYHPEEIASGLQQPMLILQAESDYQVTMEDFQIWKSALGGRRDVQFKSYAGLYHLFMPFEGGGKATPAAYSVPGHVVEEVIKDIAQWVKHAF